jgi:hypothetical protein
MPSSVLETADREALLRRVATLPREAQARWGRFTASNGMGPVHPLFGPLTHREWSALMYRHVDHHLKQFGA